MMTRSEFGKLCRARIVAGNASGATFCNGMPLAIIRGSWDYEGFLEGCTWGCCRCGRCRTTITGNIAKWPKWAPWRGPAANLRIHYTPEELARHSDRYVTDWGADGPPDPAAVERTTVVAEIGRQLKVPGAAVKLPKLTRFDQPNREAPRWLDWVDGAWVARRPCRLVGEIELRADPPTYFPLVRAAAADLDLPQFNWRNIARDESFADRAAHPHRWGGGVLTHEVALDMAEGDRLWLNGWHANPPRPFPVKGSVRLSIDHPGAGDSPPLPTV